MNVVNYPGRGWRNEMSTPAKSKHVAWKNVEREQLNPLSGREMVVGDKIMLARVILKKGAHVPLHHHHNEQVTYILEGALKFAIDGKEIVVHAGEVLCIPPHMPHEAWAIEDTVDLDVLVPRSRPAARPFLFCPIFRERAWTKGHGVVYRTYVAESIVGAAL